jgi:hypothetical protein
VPEENYSLNELKQYFGDLVALKDNIHFRRIMNRNDHTISYLQEQLRIHDPKDDVGIAKLQAELTVVEKWRDEFRDAKKTLFELEKRLQPAITKNNEGGLVPPSQ